jgi:hypothetical protein
MTSGSYAQGLTSLNAGVNIPVGAFGSDGHDDYDGGASLGMTAGLQHVFGLTDAGLGLLLGVDLNYNWLQQDVKDGMNQVLIDSGFVGSRHKYYEYLNIPVSLGFQYAFKATEQLSVFVNAALVVDFLKVTNYTVEVDNVEVRSEFDMTDNIGYKVSAGVMMGKGFSVSMQYFGMGVFDVKGTVSSMGYSDTFESKLRVDFLTLTLGFRIAGGKTH